MPWLAFIIKINKGGFAMNKRCPDCGKVMKDYGSVWECPNCGAEYSKRSKELNKIPEGCAACGGPYPSCKISCPIFDD